MPITTLTIGGAAIDLAQYPLGTLVAYSRDGIPSLSVYRKGGALAGLPDPWIGKRAVLTINGTTYFNGDVCSASPDYVDALGWVTTYQCLGLRYRGNLVPFTDDNTGLDTAPFNAQPEDPNYIASRAGRSVGQVLAAVLTMTTNAANLSNAGIGNYASFGPPVLPAATLADLATLTIIPPAPVYVGGQRMVAAIDAFLAQWAPNVTLWIDPANGTMRFLDMRKFPSHTFTLGTDPIIPCSLSRDTTDCFQRTLVRGQPWTEAMMLQWSLAQGHDGTQTGGLKELFYPDGGSNNTNAINAWKPSDFAQPGDWSKTNHSQDKGTCTCASTTTVNVTSTLSPAPNWGANYWDQTNSGRHGVIYLYDTSLGGAITQTVTRRIVANTAYSGGSMLTLDIPLPVTSYGTYVIYGLQGGNSVTWRRYQCTNAAVGAALQNSFPYAVPFVGAGGASASLTNVPVGSVLWSASGNPPYNEFPLPFTQDASSGTFLFVKPTWQIANNASPAFVRVLAAVATGANQVTAPMNAGASPVGTPPSSPGYLVGTPAYQGTSYTVDGLSRTLVVTIDAWRDPGGAASMAIYAQDLLDSVKDAVVEGQVTYLGLYEPALTMGMSANVAGAGYTTGWESLTSFAGYPGLPVTSVELDWNYYGPVSHTMRLRCSNRRAHYSAEMFLKPARTGATWGSIEGTELQSVAAFASGVGSGWRGGIAAAANFNGGNVAAANAESAANIPTTPERAGIPTMDPSLVTGNNLRGDATLKERQEAAADRKRAAMKPNFLPDYVKKMEAAKVAEAKRKIKPIMQGGLVGHESPSASADRDERLAETRAADAAKVRQMKDAGEAERARRLAERSGTDTSDVGG